jgi:predicted CXXCH cytochrome family protein
MKPRYQSIACIFFQGCLITIHGFAAAATETGHYTKEQVHGSQQECNICHVSHKGGGLGLVKKTVTELCLECHPDRMGSTEHVVGVIPSININRLPLIDGKMNCVTCHNPHKNTFENMLRIPPEKICLSCHKI